MKPVFLIICMIFVACAGRSQVKSANDSLALIEIATVPTATLTQTFYQPRTIMAIPANHYTNHFGIVCKKEWAFEKATGVALKLRLGSLTQVDRLEGKRVAITE